MAPIRPNAQQQPCIKRPRQHISLKQRRDIVRAVANEGRTFKSVSTHFNLPYSTVRSIHLNWEQTGRYDTLPRGGDKRTRLANEHIEWIKARLLDDPDLPIPDLWDELNNRFRSNHPRLNPPVGLQTVYKAVKSRIACTIKLMHPEPVHYNSPEHIRLRKEWAAREFQRPSNIDDLVFLDETGFNLHTRRRFGRAPRGVRPTKTVEPNKGPNMSLVVAVDRTGLVACEIKLKSYKGVDFAHFLRRKVFPKLQGSRILLMDNCRIHKVKRVTDLFLESPHTQLFLPAYTPHFNVAEWVFGAIKRQVKKSRVDKYTLTGYIRRSLRRTVTAAKVAGWMKEVRSHFLMALKGHPLGRLMNTENAVTRQGYSQDYSQDPYPETDNEDDEEKEKEEDEDDQLQANPDVFESNVNSRDDNNSSDTSESDTYEVDGDGDDLPRVLEEQEEGDEVEEEEEEKPLVRSRPRRSLRNK